MRTIWTIGRRGVAVFKKTNLADNKRQLANRVRPATRRAIHLTAITTITLPDRAAIDGGTHEKCVRGVRTREARVLSGNSDSSNRRVANSTESAIQIGEEQPFAIPKVNRAILTE